MFYLWWLETTYHIDTIHKAQINGKEVKRLENNMNIIVEGRFTLSYHINKCLFRHDSSNIYSLEHISLLIEPSIWIKYTCIHKTDTKKGAICPFGAVTRYTRTSQLAVAI